MIAVFIQNALHTRLVPHDATGQADSDDVSLISSQELHESVEIYGDQFHRPSLKPSGWFMMRTLLSSREHEDSNSRLLWYFNLESSFTYGLDSLVRAEAYSPRHAAPDKLGRSPARAWPRARRTVRGILSSAIEAPRARGRWPVFLVCFGRRPSRRREVRIRPIGACLRLKREGEIFKLVVSVVPLVPGSDLELFGSFWPAGWRSILSKEQVALTRPLVGLRPQPEKITLDADGPVELLEVDICRRVVEIVSVTPGTGCLRRLAPRRC